MNSSANVPPPASRLPPLPRIGFRFPGGEHTHRSCCLLHCPLFFVHPILPGFWRTLVQRRAGCDEGDLRQGFALPALFYVFGGFFSFLFRLRARNVPWFQSGTAGIQCKNTAKTRRVTLVSQLTLAVRPPPPLPPPSLALSLPPVPFLLLFPEWNRLHRTGSRFCC